MSPDRVIHLSRTDDDTCDVDDLTVRRWTRYGLDRSYVRTSSGSSIGYRDNRTGQVVVDDESFRASVEQILAGSPVFVPAQRRTPGQTCPPAPTSVPARANDLAGNRPGATALAAAEALRAATPVWSVLARTLGVRNDERAWRVGAAGAERVAAELTGLGPRWRVLHAVPVGNGGHVVDHVLLGPGGVFTIATQHHPDAAVWADRDTLMVDGERRPQVRDSRAGSTRACRLLSAVSRVTVPPVVGLVVVVCAPGGLSVSRQPGDARVRVLEVTELAGWLRQRPTLLTDAEVVHLHDVARRADTWTDGPVGATRGPARRHPAPAPGAVPARGGARRS